MACTELARRISLLTAALGAVGVGSGAIARAEEIVVRNDSVENFSTVVIVGGFINGEEGGSRLTSPCDGAIVAVQILWWAGDLGALPYLAENIWIRRGETFPTPGAVLAQLIGPVLQPFVMNEFRHLDEGQTIPINVPVTLNQRFIVTLEFSDPVFPQSGSVVRDVGDGCQTGKNVLFAPNLGGWLDFCGFPIFLQGDLVFRAVIDCVEPTGACCLATGACVEDLSANDCQGISGTFQGEGTDCNAIQCPQGPQACCFLPTGCINVTPDDCATAGGFSQGFGTTCGTIVCFPMGACCLPDGTCMDDVSPDECDASAGVFQGDETTCAAADCPLPDGACCLANDACLTLTEPECDQVPAAAWAGAFTTCTDANQNGIADDCEPPCGEPSQDFDRDCDVDLLDYAEFAACLTGAGGAAVDACTCFDGDGDGDVDLIDFSDFSRAFTGPGDGCP